jgi:tRNA (guanine26-N2/guanine27-N2)-dimethyltransferase
MEKCPLNLSFPVEIVKEGAVSVAVPKRLKAWNSAPSKAPVFFNPAMELNRDIAVLALQAYQSMVGREVSVCEPLAGCGVRGIRFAVEVRGIRKIVLGDINPKAAELAHLNVKRNNLSSLVEVSNEDANLLLSRYAAPRKRFDFIDVDPFGSPAPYMDSAVRALRDGGLLALTATDMAPLCGVHPKAGIRKYGGKPLRTEYCHELAVRLLIGCLTMTAAKHDIGVEAMFSHSTDHYIRVYALTRHGARESDKSLRKMGYILHCFTCLHRETIRELASPLKWECPECGSELSVAGPIWLGRICSGEFCGYMRREAAGRNLKEGDRILELLSLIENEADGSVTYYVTDKMCEKLSLPTPPLTHVIGELKKMGFKAVSTHFNRKGFRTDASAKMVKEVVAKLASPQTFIIPSS